MAMADQEIEKFQLQSRHHHEVVQAKKGQSPARQISRSMLLRSPNLIQASSRAVNNVLITTITKPSVASINDLTAISIAKLKIETQHNGSVLYVRSLLDGSDAVGNITAVEDEKGNHILLCLCSSIPGITAKERLRKGMIWAIKEPFCTRVVEKQWLCIQVQHISDMLELTTNHHKLPFAFAKTQLQAHSSPIALRIKGNEAVKAGDFILASWHYTAGLALAKQDDVEAYSALLCNRAHINLKLMRYEAAIEDAEQTISLLQSTKAQSSATTIRLAQAHHRLGKAYYALDHFRQAAAEFEIALSFQPGDAAILKEKARTADRLQELLTGHYDWDRIEEILATGQQYLDVAPYIRNVAVRQTKTSGKGLFALKAFKPGDIIVCEKALAAQFDGASAARATALHFSENESTYKNESVKIWYTILQKLHHNPKHVTKLLTLNGGDYAQVPEPPMVDGKVVIDDLHVFEIVRLNCHRFGNAIQLPVVEHRFKSRRNKKHTWFWSTAARIRHACVANCIPAVKGDMLILRALQDISEGEEILMSYCVHFGDAERTAHLFEHDWDMVCDCAICSADRATPNHLLVKREKALLELTENNPPRRRGQSDADALEQLHALKQQLLSTYGPPYPKHLPMPPLVQCDALECRIHLDAFRWEKAIELGLSSMKHTGYKITTNGNRLEVERNHPIIRHCTVLTLFDIAVACWKLGNFSLAVNYHRLATETHVLICGTSHGFHEYNHDRSQTVLGLEMLAGI